MNIDELEPGRELDRIVAENVIGYTTKLHKVFSYTHTRKFERLQYKHTYSFEDPDRTWTEEDGNNFVWKDVPYFSTQIPAAWDLVRRVGLFDYRSSGGLDITWTLRKYKDDWIVKYEHGKIITRGKSAPHVICLAALHKTKKDWNYDS